MKEYIPPKDSTLIVVEDRTYFSTAEPKVWCVLDEDAPLGWAYAPSVCGPFLAKIAEIMA